MKLGEYIKSVRTKLDISGRDLGNRIGKSSNYISSMEKGNFIPDYETILKLFNILSINISITDFKELFGIETVKVNVSAITEKHPSSMLRIELQDSVAIKLYELAASSGITPEQQATKILNSYFNKI